MHDARRVGKPPRQLVLRLLERALQRLAHVVEDQIAHGADAVGLADASRDARRQHKLARPASVVGPSRNADALVVELAPLPLDGDRATKVSVALVVMRRWIVHGDLHRPALTHPVAMQTHTHPFPHGSVGDRAVAFDGPLRPHRIASV